MRSTSCARRREVRHRSPRPATRLRPRRQSGGEALYRRHASGCSLRLVQSATVDATGPGRVRRGVRASWQELQMNLVYDVCHNIAKFEEHVVNGRRKRVWVHRKGATRAFPPEHPEVPAQYRKVGQPVIIPGDMGRASWVLVGQPGSMEKTFRNDVPRRRPRHEPHGSRQGGGRTSDRQGAGSEGDYRACPKPAGARRGAAEGIQGRRRRRKRRRPRGSVRKVARMRPIGVIKG